MDLGWFTILYYEPFLWRPGSRSLTHVAYTNGCRPYSRISHRHPGSSCQKRQHAKARSHHLLPISLSNLYHLQYISWLLVLSGSSRGVRCISQSLRAHQQPSWQLASPILRRKEHTTLMAKNDIISYNIHLLQSRDVCFGSSFSKKSCRHKRQHTPHRWLHTNHTGATNSNGIWIRQPVEMWDNQKYIEINTNKIY